MATCGNHWLHAQVEDETWTVLAIGPDASDRVDMVTGTARFFPTIWSSLCLRLKGRYIRNGEKNRSFLGFKKILKDQFLLLQAPWSSTPTPRDTRPRSSGRGWRRPKRSWPSWRPQWLTVFWSINANYRYDVDMSLKKRHVGCSTSRL